MVEMNGKRYHNKAMEMGKMIEEKWMKELNRYFEELRIIEKCQQEARDHFDQFCEFIVEPAFEALEQALKPRRIKVKYDRRKISISTFR